MSHLTDAAHLSEPAYGTVQQLTTAILKETNRGLLYKYVHELHGVYATITGIRATSIPNEAIHLPSGKAIGPVGAAHCLLESQRTAVFVKGIHKAILQLQNTFPGTRINILYAGCGPYATLLTPLATIFPASAIGFILLDINEVSLSAARQLFNTLGLDEYVTRFVVADATAYKLDAADNIHMVISETMLNALRREPLVAVIQNLVPQLQPQGIFIPSAISVSARLVSGREENQISNLGELCRVGNNRAEIAPEICITLPEYTGATGTLQLFTEITVFEKERLETYDCSLTLPVTLFDITNVHRGCKLRFRYAMGSNPRFEYALNDSKKFLRC